MDFQGYKSMGRVTAFGSTTWLANPRDTGTASRGNLATTTTPTNVNTVSDQFVVRAGTTVAITQQIAATLAWRMEGVPRYDMFGASHGFSSRQDEKFGSMGKNNTGRTRCRSTAGGILLILRNPTRNPR